MTVTQAIFDATLVQAVREAAIQFGHPVVVGLCDEADSAPVQATRDRAMKTVKIYAKHWGLTVNL